LSGLGGGVEHPDDRATISQAPHVRIAMGHLMYNQSARRLRAELVGRTNMVNRDARHRRAEHRTADEALAQEGSSPQVPGSE
jgi:hypothetical protein